MNKEEKEAIKETKQVIEKWNDTNWLISYDHKNLEIILNLIDKLQKENKQLKRVKEQSQDMLSRIKVIYQVHTKDCELTLKDIKKWEKILDK